MYKEDQTIKIIVYSRTLTPTSVFDFLDAVDRAWPGNENIADIGGFLEPWVQNMGYPVLHVGWLSANLVLLTQVCCLHKKYK